MFSLCPLLLLGCLLQLLFFWYLVPKAAVDPQRFLQPQAAVHAGDAAAQRAADAQQPAPDLRHALQAGLTEGVSAVQHPRDPLPPGVGLQADAALAILTQNHSGSFVEPVGPNSAFSVNVDRWFQVPGWLSVQ